MKAFKAIYGGVLALLPILAACSSELVVDNPDTSQTAPLTIKATLPGGGDTRAQITYGNEDVEAGETFMWNIKDEIIAYSKNSQKSRVYQIMDSGDINGKSATFTMTRGNVNDDEFYGHGGVANYYIATYGAEFDSYIPHKGPCMINADERVPQKKSEGTPGNADTEHLKKMLKMVACQQLGSSSETPDFQFTHLSSIMRITLRNNGVQDKSCTIKKVVFDYGQNATFYTGTLETDFSEFSGEGNPAYTGSTARTWDSGDMDITLAHGESYDLYFAVLSSAKVPAATDKLTITMNINDASESVEIGGFNVTIQPGMRYWFDLTITDTGLVQTSRL